MKNHDPNRYASPHDLVCIALSNNEGSREPVQMRRLARAFVVRIHNVSM